MDFKTKIMGRSQLICANCSKSCYKNQPPDYNSKRRNFEGVANSKMIFEISVQCENNKEFEWKDKTNGEFKSKSIKLQSAISSIYNLGFLQEMTNCFSNNENNSGAHRNSQRNSQMENESKGLCQDCGNVFQNLYNFYIQFNQLRSLDSQLAREIQQCQEIMKQIEDTWTELKMMDGDNNKNYIETHGELQKINQSIKTAKSQSQFNSSSSQSLTKRSRKVTTSPKKIQSTSNSTKKSKGPPWVILNRLTKGQIEAATTKKKNTRADLASLGSSFNLCCPLCEKSCRSTRDLSQHLKFHLGAETRWCPLCTQDCKNPILLHRHLLDHNNDPTPLLAVVRPLQSSLGPTQTQIKTKTKTKTRLYKSKSSNVNRKYRKRKKLHFSRPKTHKIYPTPSNSIENNMTTFPSSCLETENVNIETTPVAALPLQLPFFEIMEPSISKIKSEDPQEDVHDPLALDSEIDIQMENYFHCDRCLKKFSLEKNLEAHKKICRPKKRSRKQTFDVVRSDEPEDTYSISKSLPVPIPVGSETRTESVPLPSKEKPDPSVHQTTVRIKNKCPLCLETFSFESDLTLHLLLHDDNSKSTFNICPLCPTTQFELRVDLVKHLRGHTNKGPNQCTYCGKGFTGLYVLQRHEATHKNQASQNKLGPGQFRRPFKCFQCARPRRFKSWLKLNQHLKLFHPNALRNEKTLSQILRAEKKTQENEFANWNVPLPLTPSSSSSGHVGDENFVQINFKVESDEVLEFQQTEII